MNYDKIFEKINPNIKLDNNQIEAIEENENTIIVAGAGSGKTTTLTAKIKYLVEIKNIKPKDILMLSFTNEATKELIKRINIDFNIPAEILTFHKLGHKIIKKVKKFKILTDSSKIIEKIVKDKFTLFKKDEQLITQIVKEIVDYKEHNNSDKKIRKVYNQYQTYLEQNDLIDFSDMIIKATDYIERNLVKLNYKYIIVDEYQDISYIRYKLIKAIVKQTNSKIIVVGDDYQSIFSFAGSEIDLFLKFKEEFNAKMYFLNKTYRNSQQLIDIASKFVLINNNQIIKKLKSDKTLLDPIVICKRKNLKKLLKKLDGQTLILGRYIFDKNKIIRYLNDKVHFMTIHAAKGLEFDNVIIINLEKGKYGFPSKRSNIEEERRLMYVALTRTKNKVFILIKKGNSSRFLKEIKKLI